VISLLRRRSLGDVVLLGAVTGALPGCVVVTEPRYAEVAARLRGVGRVLPWGERPPGRVVDLQGDLRTRLAHPLAARIHKRSVRRRLGLGRPLVTALYAEAAGVDPLPPPWIDAPGGDGLALIPGASTSLKSWPATSYAALGRRWAGPVVVVGGPGEEALCAGVAAAIPGARAVVGEGFVEVLAALGRCRVAVGGDTGLLHLAAACGATPVAVFGPTHPRDGFFPYPRGRVVSLALPCRPCTLHRRESCPEGHHGCMGVSVAAVWAEVAACASSC
jgi:hypothetical protein